MSGPDPDSRPGRTGRRPGRTDTRGAILAAARKRFADNGFDKTSIRAVATDAGVDPALVHHYFGTKQELFAAAVELPMDPNIVLQAIAAAPVDELGETIVRVVLGVWDSAAGPGLVATMRSIIGGGESANSLARSFLLEIVLKRVRERIATPEDDGRFRVAMAISQMGGLLLTRKLLELPPMTEASVDEIVAAAGPTLQRYLTGDIGSGTTSSAGPTAKRQRPNGIRKG
ncbi:MULTISPECIES: TetR family transcriptional regulator [unclassified Nocardia]|uniref:TetR/AcrR family transcriptional regulator n=1 Tax=unclassified Nocardia TaxID=2637762 RepID=UPI001CE3E788|nr:MULTISPECIES: TetR family transcriptional regulator [unclassified Nocardia]